MTGSFLRWSEELSFIPEVAVVAIFKVVFVGHVVVIVDAGIEVVAVEFVESGMHGSRQLRQYQVTSTVSFPNGDSEFFCCSMRVG